MKAKRLELETVEDILRNGFDALSQETDLQDKKRRRPVLLSDEAYREGQKLFSALLGDGDLASNDEHLTIAETETGIETKEVLIPRLKQSHIGHTVRYIRVPVPTPAQSDRDSLTEAEKEEKARREAYDELLDVLLGGM